jgi:hypothetical protein
MAISEYRRRIFASRAVGAPSINVGAFSSVAEAQVRGATNIGNVLRQSGDEVRRDTANLANAKLQNADALANLALNATRLAVTLADRKTKVLANNARTERQHTEFEIGLQQLQSQVETKMGTTDPDSMSRVFLDQGEAMRQKALEGQTTEEKSINSTRFESTLGEYAKKIQGSVDGYRIANVKADAEMTQSLLVKQAASQVDLNGLLKSMGDAGARIDGQNFRAALGPDKTVMAALNTKRNQVKAYFDANMATGDKNQTFADFQYLKPELEKASVFGRDELAKMETDLVDQFKTRQSREDILFLYKNHELASKSMIELENGQLSALTAQGYVDAIDQKIEQTKLDEKIDEGKKPLLIKTLENDRETYQNFVRIAVDRGGDITKVEQEEALLAATDAVTDLFGKFNTRTKKFEKKDILGKNNLESLAQASETRKIISGAVAIGAITRNKAIVYFSAIDRALGVLGQKIKPETQFTGGIETQEHPWLRNYSTTFDYGLKSVMDEVNQRPAKERKQMKATVVPEFFRLYDIVRKQREETGQQMDVGTAQKLVQAALQPHYQRENPASVMGEVGQMGMTPVGLRKIAGINPVTGKRAFDFSDEDVRVLSARSQ